MDLTPIIIVFIVVGLPVISMTLIKLAKIVTGDGRASRNRGSSQEEAEIMQQIHLTLTKLEKRIDSLETIVLDKHNR